MCLWVTQAVISFGIHKCFSFLFQLVTMYQQLIWELAAEEIIRYEFDFVAERHIFYTVIIILDEVKRKQRFWKQLITF